MLVEKERLIYRIEITILTVRDNDFNGVFVDLFIFCFGFSFYCCRRSFVFCF